MILSVRRSGGRARPSSWAHGQVDTFDGPSSVPRPGIWRSCRSVRSGIEVGLVCLQTLVERFGHLDAEELVEDGAVEALGEAVGLGRSHPGTAMLDAVEVEM